MVQGGYVSPSSAKTLTVNKRTNVLNKIPPRGPKNSTNNSNSTNNNNNNNNNSSELSAGIDVSVSPSPGQFYSDSFCIFFGLIENFFCTHLFRCAQESQLKELMDELKKQSEEMRKLKAIIVKHENRIRSLEAAQKAREDDALDIILQNNDGDSKRDSNLAPDEV